MERKKRNRIAALLLAATILVIMLYSAFFVCGRSDDDRVAKAARFAIRLMLAKTH